MIFFFRRPDARMVWTLQLDANNINSLGCYNNTPHGTQYKGNRGISQPCMLDQDKLLMIRAENTTNQLQHIENNKIIKAVYTEHYRVSITRNSIFKSTQ